MPADLHPEVLTGAPHEHLASLGGGPVHAVSMSSPVVANGRSGPSSSTVLAIRTEQIRALGERARAAVEDELTVHLERTFGPYAAALGRADVRATVSRGVRRAEAHGLWSAADLRCYLELVFLLGSGFDRDPLLPWASRILGDAEAGEPSARIHRVRGDVIGHLQETAGHDACFLLAALPRLACHPWDAWSIGEGRTLDQAVAATLREVYPEKQRALERHGLAQVLVDGSRQTAALHGIIEPAGLMLVAALQLVLGSEFDDDPQFSWARRALLRTAEGSSADKTAALLHEARAFLARLRARMSPTGA